jgi:hypothetical protein
VAKASRFEALSMLALNRHQTPGFIEAVTGADDRLSVLSSWVNLHPPEDPQKIIRFLNKQTDTRDLVPYFALHGCIKLIPKGSPFRSFFPDFRTPPEMQLVAVAQPAAMFDRCRQFRDAELFRDCANEGIEILKY